MKCTWNNCGKETGKLCPPQWEKHKDFSPLVLRIFFIGTNEVTEEDIKDLDAFVCHACMPIYERQCKASNASRRAAKKRIKEDYSI